MSKVKNLNVKKLNKVSGGGVINLMSNPRFSKYLEEGILPDGVSEVQIEQEMNFAEHVFDKGYITPTEKTKLNGLGFNI